MEKMNHNVLQKVLDAYAVIQTKIAYDEQKLEKEEAFDILNYFNTKDLYYYAAMQILLRQIKKGNVTEELDIDKIEEILNKEILK